MKIEDFIHEGDTRTRRTARDVVAADLRSAIIRGEIAPGTKLNPTDLAERLGVSQTPAREAIQLLASEGLVSNNDYRGARVSPLTVEEYEELLLMRIGLEGLAARLGAERITDDGLIEMQRLFKGMEQAAKAGDIDRFYDCDRRFHFIHYAATGRESLVRRIMRLRMTAERYMRRAYVTPKVSMRDTIKTHRALLDAVRRHDGPRCEEVLRADMLRTLETFADHLSYGDPAPDVDATTLNPADATGHAFD